MSAPASIRIDFKRQAELASDASVPLQSLTCPAAIVNWASFVGAVNAAWSAEYKTAPGDSWRRWCGEAHTAKASMNTALLTGIQNILNGAVGPFLQDCTECARPHRVTVSSCPEGALILNQFLPTPKESDRQISARMETMGRLASGVVHDFANLITLICGYSDIVMSHVGGYHPLRPELDEIRKAALRGARLTQQLLGFSRGEGLEAKPLDLNRLVVDIEAMLKPIIGEHIEVITDLSPDLGTIEADPGQLEQVLMNLILNARDATPAGGRIRIQTANCELDESTASIHGVEPGRYILLSVSDNGRGIDSSSMPHIFDPFFTTKEAGRGTGLGLSNARAIVRQAGGDIWVCSAPGEGACFRVCLPRIEDTPEEDVPLKASAGGQGETVLLVEDEDNVRRLLTLILRRCGYEVLEAASGHEALEIFNRRGSEIHLVLTDMVMPNMTGRELGERLETLRPNTKIMYMSGYTDDVLRGTGALSPGMSFLAKPLRPEMLAARIREALDAPARRGSAQ
jgi:two-component system, cell cycle sensor histidine kinase and response regulator CckA